MTNIIKRKGLLSLMAVVVMIAMMSVACKNKATRPADFNMAEDIELADQVNKSEELVPDSAINIDTRYGILQYGSKYFESAEYQNADGTKFRYAIEFIEDIDPQFGKGILLRFTGYDKSGAKIDKTYSVGSVDFKRNSAERQAYVPYQFGLMESSDLIIYKTGYVDFKAKGFDAHIRLALKNK